jgi:peptidoglycan/LPS O-acetylase OafA/YrhL
MTATLTPTTTSTVPAAGATRTRSLWRTGAIAGVIAAAATVAVAAAAHGLGVSLETAPGEAVPILGFGQLTLFFTAIGVLIARSVRRRARQPRATLVKVSVALTALSLVPDVALSAGAATKMTFILTHLVAAAIVVPALASRLPQQRTA